MGDYTFEVTITNASGMSITSDVDVTVGQIPATLSITPGTATVAAGDTQEFDFSGSDQFGAALDEPALNWTATDSAGDNAVSGDDGTIDSYGFYTAPTDNAGTITITARGPSSASASASASVNVPVTTPNLTAAEGSDGSHIDLNWDFDDTALNNAAGFDLERKATGESTYTVIATITDATATAFTDTAVSNGTTYDYRLKPYVHIGGLKVFGTAAGPASVTMVGMINSTSADDPVLVNSGGMATISLPFSDSNASATHTATIDWGDGTTSSPDVTTATVTEASGSTSATISASKTGLADGTYDATVTITNTDGTVTPIPVEIEVGGIPSAPTGASASVTGGNVTVGWSAPSTGHTPTGYTIYGSTDGGTTWTAFDEVDASVTSDSVYGLTPSSSYLFHITATNDFGESTAGLATSSITSPAIPGTPTNVSATLTAGNVRLDWTTADALATAYNIYESTDGGSTFSYFDSVTGDPATSTAPATNYTATDLTAETTPKFYVTAQDASGESAASGTVSVAVPTPVTGVTATLNSTDTIATVHWTPIASAIGYYVERIPDDGSTPTLLPEVTPGTTTQTTDTGLDATKAYSWTVAAVYPTSLAIGGAGSGGGGTGSDDGSGGGSGSGSSTDGSAGSSTGTGTDGGSDPSDDYTGEIGDFDGTSTSGTGTAHLTWSYQGPATFEIEEKDPTVAGSNYFWIDTTSASARSYDVSGLEVGDQYGFRIRAVRTDGTVSDYKSGNVTTNGPSATLSVSTDDEDGFSPGYDLSWSAGAATSGAAITSYLVQFHADDLPGVGWGTLYTFDADTTQAIWPAVTDETMFYRVQARYADGTVSQWSDPQQATGDQGATDPDAITKVSASATSAGTTSVNIQYNASAPSFATDAQYFWGITYEPHDDAVDSDLGYQPLTNYTGSGTTTITGLQPGVKYDFRVGVIWRTNLGPSHFDGGSGSKLVTTTTEGESGSVPLAPASISAVQDPDDQNHVDVHWVNSSNDENGFKVLRSIGGGGYVQIADATGDQTTVTDQLPFNFVAGEALSYEAEATNMAGTSGPATTQPATNFHVTFSITPKIFQIYYKGPGQIIFNQTVQINGRPVTADARTAETREHDGRDPFNGPVGDNSTGNPNAPYTDVMRLPGGFTFTDIPNFDAEGPKFSGQKVFVTTLKNASGQAIWVVKWHLQGTIQKKALIVDSSGPPSQ